MNCNCQRSNQCQEKQNINCSLSHLCTLSRDHNKQNWRRMLLLGRGRRSILQDSIKYMLHTENALKQNAMVKCVFRTIPCHEPGKTQYPLPRKLGGPQGQSRQVQEISPPLGFEPQTIQLTASHYWLCHPGCLKINCTEIMALHLYITTVLWMYIPNDKKTPDKSVSRRLWIGQ
jgi:hypothetical protein